MDVCLFTVTLITQWPLGHIFWQLPAFSLPMALLSTVVATFRPLSCNCPSQQAQQLHRLQRQCKIFHCLSICVDHCFLLLTSCSSLFCFVISSNRSRHIRIKFLPNCTYQVFYLCKCLPLDFPMVIIFFITIKALLPFCN